MLDDIWSRQYQVTLMDQSGASWFLLRHMDPNFLTQTFTEEILDLGSPSVTSLTSRSDQEDQL